MSELVLKRRRPDPEDGSSALMFFGTIAAAGFFWGWLANVVL